MGVVYRAIDLDLERTVALKVIAPEHVDSSTAVSRFRSEAKVAAGIDHPNIVTVYGFGEYEGTLFLAMQFIAGTDLRSMIEKHPPLDLCWTASIVAQVASALDAAHSRGLVHRDVKPANILLSREREPDRAYLTDFGLTKRLSDSDPGVTRSGQWVGTPDYAAPEQIQGRAIDGRTDVYSLGCVVYQLLTGRLPYEQPNAAARLCAHLFDPPPSPRVHRSELLPVFDWLVVRATAKEPEERFDSAGSLAGALEEAVKLQLTDTPKRAAQPSWPTSTPTPLSEQAATDSPVSLADLGRPRSEPETSPVKPARQPSNWALVRDEGDRRAGWRRVRGRSVALLAALLVGAAVTTLVVVSSGGGPAPTAGAVRSQNLKHEVIRLNAIVQLFIAGKHLSQRHQYAAAAQNRRRVLRMLTAFRAPPKLRDSAGTLREMATYSLSYNLLAARGETASAAYPNGAHNALRPQFVAEFNPYAERYLRRTYAASEL
jgi:serine/threonine-protein kinase